MISKESIMYIHGFEKIAKDPPPPRKERPYVSLFNWGKKKELARMIIPWEFLAGPLRNPVFIGYFYCQEKNLLALRRLRVQDGGVRLSHHSHGDGIIDFTWASPKINFSIGPTKRYPAKYDRTLDAVVIDLNTPIQQ